MSLYWPCSEVLFKVVLTANEVSMMTSFKRAAVLSFGMITTVFLSLHSAHAEVDALNVLASEKEFPRVSRSYSSMDARPERLGTHLSVSQVRRVALGDSQRELVQTIGNPVSAYKDGSWNFNLALPLPQRNRLVCQYRVFFDSEKRVSGTIWRRPQCAEMVIQTEN